MMAKKKSSSRSLNAANKPAGKKRSKASSKKSGAPFNEQDPKRRLGNFTGAGEHARKVAALPESSAKRSDAIIPTKLRESASHSHRSQDCQP